MEKCVANNKKIYKLIKQKIQKVLARSGKLHAAASEWGPVIEEIRGFAQQTAGFLHNPAQPAATCSFPRE